MVQSFCEVINWRKYKPNKAQVCNKNNNNDYDNNNDNNNNNNNNNNNKVNHTSDLHLNKKNYP